MAKIEEELGSRRLSPFEAAASQSGGRVLLWTVAGALAIALGARVTVSFDPVPMTLQTLAVLGVGGLLGSRVGAGAALFYLGLVLVGLPLLSNGTTAPASAFLDLKSGGYVLGFIPAAFVAGYSGRNVLQSLLVMAAAHVVILAIGASWLAHHIGWSSAFEFGLRPFLWGAVVKTFVAAALVQHFVEWRRPR